MQCIPTDYIKKNKMSCMLKLEGISIPIPCPRCNGKMIAVRYEAPLKILKERSWQICKRCGFQRSAEEFKQRLLTV